MRATRIARSCKSAVLPAALSGSIAIVHDGRRSLITAAESGNPLLMGPTNGLFPRFADVKADHVISSIDEQLSTARAGFAELETRIHKTLEAGRTPTFGDLSEEAERLDFPIESSWSVVSHLKAVKDNEALRDAHGKAQPKIVEYSTERAQSVSFYKGWCALRDNPKLWDCLTNGQRRTAELAILGAELKGIGLEGEKRERFNEITKELASLSTSFSDNLQDATKAFAHKITAKSDVAGLPESALRMLAANARAKGDADATPEAGPWTVTLDGPCFMSVMKYADDATLRERVYRAYVCRASEHGDGKDNTEVINQILKLKREKAELLGYKSHAEVSLVTKMASLESAKSLLEDLRQKCYGPAQQELRELEAFAGKKIALWDQNYYAEKLKQERFSYDEETAKQYFSLDRVLAGLFGVVEKIFGAVVVERSPQEIGAQIWDESVRVFELQVDGQARAYFYLDPFARAAEKRGGAWMSQVCGRSKTMAPLGSTVRLPVAHMVTNQSPPVTNADGSIVPSLMTFSEVTTLFHECGHALQHMLTQVDEAEVAGISGVEWDAVEQPSQFMENWAYNTDTLKGMAEHWKTGETIPDDLIDKIRAAKNFRAASMMLRQMRFALTDLALHDESFVPGGNKTIWDIDCEVGKKTSVIPTLPEDRFLCGFSHIFAGGYSAGYYSYIWAEVLSSDGFAAFEEVGLENEEAVKKLGRRYADTVMGMGGSRPAVDIFKAFRGRDPSVDALLRHNGLVPSSKL